MNPPTHVDVSAIALPLVGMSETAVPKTMKERPARVRRCESVIVFLQKKGVTLGTAVKNRDGIT